MAITFESIKDPYGLGAAGNAIGGAFLQKALMDRQQNMQLQNEERLRNQQIQNSQTLGTTLNDLMPAEGQQWDQDRIASFMSQALQNGASIGDIVETIKGLQSQQKTRSNAVTPFTREMAKKNVNLLNSYTENGKVAKEMLSTWDELDKAINDPERSDNTAIRALKNLPGASVTYGAGDQTIANYGKQVITNFTNMKNLRLTDAKLRWLESIAPAPWKSKEANAQASAYFKRFAQIQEAYGDIADNLANSYAEAGLDLPNNFNSLVEKAVEPLRAEIENMYKMSVEQNGNQQKSVEVGSTFNKMPNPKDYEGAEITDSKGTTYRSDGTKWRKVK